MSRIAECGVLAKRRRTKGGHDGGVRAAGQPGGAAPEVKRAGCARRRSDGDPATSSSSSQFPVGPAAVAVLLDRADFCRG